jgi:hypothetical protein
VPCRVSQPARSSSDARSVSGDRMPSQRGSNVTSSKSSRAARRAGSRTPGGAASTSSARSPITGQSSTHSTGDEERLPPEHLEPRRRASRAAAEQDHPPRPVWRFDQVGVTGVLDRAVGAPVADDGVVRTGFPRSRRRRPARDGDRVAALGATLRDEEVPVLTAADQVRSLGVLRSRPRPRDHRWLEHRAGAVVDATARDLAQGGVDPAVPVIVPREVEVDAEHVVTDPADAGIGMEAGDHRVLKAAHACTIARSLLAGLDGSLTLTRRA